MIIISSYLVSGSAECRVDTECRTSEVCHTGTCVNACLIKKCGFKAICTTTVHDAICSCPEGYTGIAEDKCKYSKYTTDQNSHLFCRFIYFKCLINLKQC
jgi:hypothetical protein